MVQRMVRFVAVALVLGGCAVGGSSAPVTPAPPTATTAPTPTPADDSSNIQDLKLLLPPNAEPYVKGTDPAIDEEIAALEEQFGPPNISGLRNFYRSTMPISDVETFYDTEMPKHGWIGGQGGPRNNPYGKSLAYQSPLTARGSSIALIILHEPSTPDSKGIIILSGIMRFPAPGR